MNREYELKKFIRLLKDAGVYSYYFMICKKSSLCNGNYPIKEVMLKDDELLPSRWLSSYNFFTTWSSTKQGRDYWVAIQMIWLNLLKKTKIFHLSELRFEISLIGDKVLKQRLERIIKTYSLF